MRPRAALAVLLLAGACVGSDLTECAGGVVCPRGSVCAPSGESCVAEASIAACRGRGEGEACSYGGFAGECAVGLCAVAATPSFTLHVTLPGAGAGRVVSDPAGIDCGATCAAELPSGTRVVLTATPLAASSFAGWSGPCAGRDTCELTVTAETTVSASFLLPPAPTISGVEPEVGTGVGGTVVILGTDFTAASAVSFAGTDQPVFTVVSPARIETTVPAGARPGAITVTTPGGTAASRPFTLILADVDSVSVPAVVGGCVTIGFEIAQGQSRPANVRVEVDPGTGTFSRATGANGSAGVNGLATSPAGAPHTFVWNSTADLPHDTAGDVKLRVSATVANATGSGGRSATRIITVHNGVDLAAAVDHPAVAAWWALGDVDRDGATDVIVAARGGEPLLLRGDGRGGLAPPAVVAAGAGAELGRLVDSNADGQPDLVLVAGDVTVRLGRGDGTFAAAAAPLAAQARWLETADLDRDGRRDLLLGGEAAVATARGNGDGTFQPVSTVPGTDASAPASVGDVDRDGTLDLVAVAGDVAAALGDGAGGFAAPRRTPLPFQGVTSTLVDLDRDGRLDLVAGGASRGALLLGNGDGTFGAPWELPGWTEVVGLATGDVSLDGKVDLVAVSAGTQPMVRVFGADGTLADLFALPAGTRPLAVAIAELDGDARPDVLVLHEAGVLALRNTTPLSCDVGFLRSAVAPVSYHPTSIVAADLDGDGKVDLAVSNAGSNTISLLDGRGDGTFAPQRELPGSAAPRIEGNYHMSVAAGDLDRDGALDLVVATSDTQSDSERDRGNVSLHYGRGDGTFEAPRDLPFDGAAHATIGDVDGDGRLDIVCDGTFLAVSLADGDRSFAPFATIPARREFVDTGDLDADGRLDVVTSDWLETAVYLGHPGAPALHGLVTVERDPREMHVADLTGDGIADLVIRTYQAFSVLRGRGDGTFEPQIDHPFVEEFVLAFAAGDFDRDGRSDLLVSYGQFDGALAVVYSNAAGGYDPRVAVPEIKAPSVMTVADVDGDGGPDLLLAGINDTSITVLLSRAH